MHRNIDFKTVVSIALIAGLLGALAAYAATEFRKDYFVATHDAGGQVLNWDDTYLSEDALHFTNGVNKIRFVGGDDAIWMAAGNDEINMGPGSDVISFHGAATGGDIETLQFDQAGKAGMQWTSQYKDLTIKNEAGNIIIQLGQ